MALQMSSLVAGFSRLTVRSTTETSMVGTRIEMPVSLPLSSGITLPTALAAPVVEGMMLPEAARPPRQSLSEGPSTVFWVAVIECTVDMRPFTMPNFSLSTFATGARQLVVQEALETICCPAYVLAFTPHTNIGVSSLEGADITTYFAPASMWACDFSLVRKRPVDSTTYSAPTAPHAISAGFLQAVTRISLPFTISRLFSRS